MTDALTKSDAAVGMQWRQATDVAGVVRDFALKRVLNIKGKRYPPVEVWQAIANAFGCVASSKDVKRSEGGFSAIGEVRRMSDGAVISEAEGFLGDDEPTWAQRPVFARRAMAQTRAISRACRSAFAFVIPLIDSGLQTTPAEEMEGIAEPAPAPAVAVAVPMAGKRMAAIKQQLAARQAALPPGELTVESEPEEPGADAEEEPQEAAPQTEPVVKFGSEKGKPPSAFSDKNLGWYLKIAREDVTKNDPKWGEKNKQWLATLEAEAARRKK